MPAALPLPADVQAYLAKHGLVELLDTPENDPVQRPARGPRVQMSLRLVTETARPGRHTHTEKRDQLGAGKGADT